MNQKSIKTRIETKMVTMFKNQTALNFLLKHGHVYTCRIHRHKLGKDWVNDGRTRPKIADVDITFVKDVTQLEDLKPYVSKSGFRDLIEWNNAIGELNPRFAFGEVKNGYLYKVSIRKVK